MQFHPVTDIFPMMTDAELEDLAADIRQNGLLTSIWTWQGQIIDGRNRYKACLIAGEEPRFQEWDGDEKDLVAFVLALNLKRRHLDASQRAVIGLAVEKYEAGRGKDRMIAGGKVTTKQGKEKIPYPVEEQGQARDFAAAAVGVNPRYIQEAKRIEAQAPDLIPQIASGRINIPEAKREVDQRQRANDTEKAVVEHGPAEVTAAATELREPLPMDGNTYQPVAATMFSHKSLEYYTPVYILEAARQVLGTIDLDPASCAAAQLNVKAAAYYTQEQDGLAQAWYGRVWLNPPYSKTEGKSNQELWSQKLLAEYRAGNVTAAILLVKAAFGYKWFEALFDEMTVCLARERLPFIREDGNDDGESKQGTALFYLGPDKARFYTVFQHIGRVIPNANEIKTYIEQHW